MLHKGAEDEATDEQQGYRKPQPLGVGLMRDDQQERVDGQQHGSEHQQDVGYQDARRHIVAETDDNGLIRGIVLPVDGDIVLQFPSDRLNRQGSLPLTVFPCEIDCGVFI